MSLLDDLLRPLDSADTVDSPLVPVREGVMVDVEPLSSIVDRLFSALESVASDPVRDLPELDFPILNYNE